MDKTSIEKLPADLLVEIMKCNSRDNTFGLTCKSFKLRSKKQMKHITFV